MFTSNHTTIVDDIQNENSQHDYSNSVDDYKLVFISSDSSSKEEEYEDSSSTTSSIHTGNSIVLDECDWDYFEPGASSVKINKLKDFNSPLGSPVFIRKTKPVSPRFIRRGVSESPSLGSRKGINDTDLIDEEMFQRVRNRYGSDEYLFEVKKKRLCHDSVNLKHSTCSCGGSISGTTTQYVPIAVPVPIIVPVKSNNSEQMLDDVLDASCMQKAIQQQIYLWNNTNTGFLMQQQNIETINSMNNTVNIAHIQQHQEIPLTQITNASKDEKIITIKNLIQEPQEQTGIQKQQTDSIVFRNNESIMYSTSTKLSSSTGLTVEQSGCRNNNNSTAHRQTNTINNTIAGELYSCNSKNDYFKVASDVVNETLRLATNIIDKTKRNICMHNDNIENQVTDKNIIDDDKCDSKKHLNNYYDSETNVLVTNRTTMNEEAIKHENSSYIDTKPNESNLIKYSSSSVEKDSELNGNTKMISVGKIMQEPDSKGYLLSECVFSSDSESNDSEDSDSSELCDSLKEPSNKISVQRCYDVQGASGDNQVLDESPSSSTHEDASFDDTDSDDTGTVPDHRPKRFTKVFVVNHNDSSSSNPTSEDDSTQSEEDSSDNDTDIDRDCGIVLNYIKNLSGSDNEEDDRLPQVSLDTIDDMQEIKLNYVKPIPDDDMINEQNLIIRGEL